MNAKKTKKTAAPAYDVLKDAPVAYFAEPSAMVRTQIYLSRQEHEFVQAEAERNGQPMAAVIRAFIDEKMAVPAEVWDQNPLLAPPAPDASWKTRPDGSLNHDHYIYGAPKQWMRRKGKWVETPPLPEDYYSNAVSRRAYDKSVDHDA